MRPATKLCVDPPLCTCRINTGLSPNMFMQTAKALTCTWPRPARCSNVQLCSNTFSNSCALVPGRILWTATFEADTPTSCEWPSRHQRGNLNARSKDPPHSYNESRGKCWKVGSSSGVGSSRTVMTNPAGTGADVTSLSAAGCPISRRRPTGSGVLTTRPNLCLRVQVCEILDLQDIKN